MRIIDASGPIYEGMWSYGKPFTDFKLTELYEPDWIDGFHPKQQGFEGFHMLTGTYMSCPAHGLGLDKSYPAHEVPLEKLFNVDAYVINIDLERMGHKGNRPFITSDDIKKAERVSIPPESPVLFSTGWGTHWGEKDFCSRAWYFTKDAIEYLIAKKPFILGGDTPYFDNIEDEEGNWSLLFDNNVIILAPLVNLEKIKSPKVKLFAAPLKILNTYGLPCRVIINESE